MHGQSNGDASLVSDREMVESYGLKELGWDKVPTYITEKRVTELMDLTGKKAIVTGAGGVGLGFAISNRLAGLGAAVVMVDISEKVIEKAKIVAERWNAKTHPILCDLMDYDAVSRMFKEAVEWFGGEVDILVNNANYTICGPFQNFTKEDIRTAVDGPYTSVIYCCRHACDYMIPQKHGKIINISSESSVRSRNVDMSIYAASKSGVNGLTRSLAGELAPYGITVNCVSPGVMLHSELRQLFEEPVPETLGVRKSMVVSTQDALLGRVSIPEEVANTVAFLCTDAASFIDGQNIMNGGGMVVT
ncbi:MAG: SDR family NAD(P)-dependent oxidoreductase [Oscillospiraceae bacterium]